VEARRVIAGGLRSDVISPARSGVELRLRFRQSEQHKLGFSWYTELYFRGDTCSSEERYISKPKFILQGDQSCRTPPPTPSTPTRMLFFVDNIYQSVFFSILLLFSYSAVSCRDRPKFVFVVGTENDFLMVSAIYVFGRK